MASEPDARAILRVLRREWEMAHVGSARRIGREGSGAFTAALDELQAAMLVVPSQVVYEPKFTYIWTLAVGRFREALTRRMTREHALREIAHAFLRAPG